MSTLWGSQLSGSGTTHWGNAGLGVLGATVPSTGTHGPAAAYPYLSSPTTDNVEVQWLMTVYPSAGVFDMGEDTGFTLTGAPDGAYTFSGVLKFDGVPQGTYTHNITVGSPAGTDDLTAVGMTTGQPTVSLPGLGQGHALGATGVTAGQPVLGSPALGGSSVHALSAVGITTGAPVLGVPTLDAPPPALGSLVGSVYVRPARRPSNRQSGFRS